MEANNPEHLLRNPMNNPIVRQCWDEIKEIAGYDYPDINKKVFSKFHKYVTTPEPVFIAKWKLSEKDKRWYNALVNGILGDTQNAYGGVYYHFDRLTFMQTAVAERLESSSYKEALGNWTIAGGNSLKMDFEYQAFVFAYRRCLDYLTRALSAAFKNQFHSFNGFPKFLANREPKALSEAIGLVHNRYIQGFKFVLSEGDYRSVRDTIAHYRFVGAGNINSNKEGNFLAGGGEGLNGYPNNKFQLTNILTQRVSLLTSFIDEMLIAFICEAGILDNKD